MVAGESSEQVVGIDLRPLEPDFKAHFGRGTGRYAEELSTRLLQNGSTLSPRVEGFGSRQLGASGLERRLYRLAPLGRVTLEQQMLLPRRIGRLPVNLFHFFAHVDAPAMLRVPYVLTVLDLIPLRFPDLYTADKPNWRFRFARFLELKAIERAKGIIAISEATKKDLIELLNVPEEQIVVTHLAGSGTFRPRSIAGDQPLEEQLFSLRRELKGLSEQEQQRPMLLYVGGIDARKNVLFMLRMYAELLKNISSEIKPFLVMIGRYENDPAYPKLKNAIREYALEDDIKLAGYVSDEELEQYYHGATLVLFPSLFEGFGLPVLEAMACGVPVIAGRNSSIPELVGDTGCLAEDNDLDSWVRQTSRLLSSEEHQRALSRDGLEREKLFSWEKTASETLKAYRRFLHSEF